MKPTRLHEALGESLAKHAPDCEAELTAKQVREVQLDMHRAFADAYSKAFCDHRKRNAKYKGFVTSI